MQITITLTEYGPPMWFFQEGDIDIQLTFVEEYNKASLDLEKVSKDGLSYIVGSVQGGLIAIDRPLSEVLKYLSKEQVVEEELPPEKDPTVIAELNQKFLSSEARRYQHREVLQRRCENLAKSSFKALRSGLSRETNQVLILEVLKLEKQGKNRKVAIDFLEKKLKSLRHKKLKAAVKESSVYTPQAEKAFMVYNNPEEEEVKLIDFDTTSLIQLIPEETP